MYKLKHLLWFLFSITLAANFAHADSGSFQISLDNVVHYDDVCTPGQGFDYHFTPAASFGAFTTVQKSNCIPVYPYAGYPSAGHIIFIPKAAGFSIACDDTSSMNSCKGVGADYIYSPSAKCTFTNAATGANITQATALPITAPPPPDQPFPVMTINYSCDGPPPPPPQPTTYHVNVNAAGIKLTNFDISKVNSQCDEAQGCQSVQLMLNAVPVKTPWAFNGNALAIQNVMPNQTNSWQLQTHYILPSVDGTIANVDVTCDTNQQTLTDGGNYTLNCQEHAIPPQPVTYHVNLQMTGTTRIDLSKVNSTCSADGCVSTELQLNGSDVKTPWAVNGSSLDIPNVMPNQSNNWQMQLHYNFPDATDPSTSITVDCDTGSQSLVNGNTYTLVCQEHNPTPETYHVNLQLTGTTRIDLSKVSSDCSTAGCASTELKLNGSDIATPWAVSGTALDIPNVMPNQSNNWEMLLHYIFPDQADPTTSTFVDCDTGQQLLVNSNTYTVACQEHTAPTPPPKTYHITVNLTGNGAYMLNQSQIDSACDQSSIMKCTSTSLTVNSSVIPNWGFNGTTLAIDNVQPYQQNTFQLTGHYWAEDPQEPMQDTYIDCDTGSQVLVDGGTYNLDCEMIG